MSGQVVERLPCQCGSRKGKNVFINEDNTYSAYCFACKSYDHDPYKDKPKDYKPPVAFKKTPEEIAAEIKAISAFKSFELPDRKLRKDSVEYFNVKVGVSEQDGVTPETHYYPYLLNDNLVGYKVRYVANKKFFAMGDIKECDLFGWKQAIQSGSKRLYITEGEIDAISLYQLLKDNNRGTEWAAIEPAVVSIVKGSSSARGELAQHLKSIREYFKEIVLVFDKDAAGQKAVVDVLQIIPDALVATLPAKDVNECLVQGRAKACIAAVLFNAKKPKNTRIVSCVSVEELAKKPVEWGYSWPYKQLTDLTRGIRLGETYYLGAGVKMGKSELLNDIVAHLIKEHGWRVFVAKPEEANHRTLQGIVGKLTNHIFHDPKIPFDHDAFDKGMQVVSDKLFLLNLYQELSLETLKSDIREAASEGCKAIFIDPITVLSNGFDAATANTLLQKMAQELAQMAMDLNIVIFMFCHLKAPDNGLSHERGGSVQSHQFAGSRAMMRSANLMIGLEGNKDPDLPEDQRNTRSLVVLENRMSGETGRVNLFYDRHTGSFNEMN